MDGNHKALIARSALILFLASLAFSPILCVLAEPHSPRRTSVPDKRFLIPKLTTAQRIALIKEAQGAYRKLVQTQTGDTRRIPPEFWGATIASVKPLRVVNDRANIKIVLAEHGGIEAGFYVNLQISSFAPGLPGPDDFLEYVLLSEAEDKAFGSLYRYKLALPDPKGTSGAKTCTGMLWV